MGGNLQHIPYRGHAPMTTDLISGVIPIGIDVLTAYVPYFKSGQLVPDNFSGLGARPHLLAGMVVWLNAACNEILASVEIRKKIRERGITLCPTSPAAFTGFAGEEVAALAPTVKGAGVRL